MRVRLSALAGLLLLAVRPAAAQNVPVRFMGELRTRAEVERPAVLDTVDSFALLRARLGVEATLSEKALVFVQVQDARTFGEEPSTTDGRASRLDLHQGWLQYRIHSGKHALSLRAGRQEVLFGNERLVGVGNWTNTGRAFDGLRATLGPHDGNWRLHTLAATVSERGRRLAGVSAAASDHLFAGSWLQAGKLELYALHDREATALGSIANIDRTTLGGRVETPQLAGLTASAEGFYQLGNQLRTQNTQLIDQDIGAFLLGARLAYATPSALLPRIGVGVDLVSGDDDPNSSDYSAFNTLYATGHKFYGYIDLFPDPLVRTRERGLIDGMASLRVAFSKQLAVDVDAHGFWLHEQFAGSTARELGWELDLTLPIQLGPGQLLHLGYSGYRNGAAAPLVGIGENGRYWHWVYVQATFSFGGSGSPIL